MTSTSSERENFTEQEFLRLCTYEIALEGVKHRRIQLQDDLDISDEEWAIVTQHIHKEMGEDGRVN